jgi:hypothetical protein
MMATADPAHAREMASAVFRADDDYLAVSRAREMAVALADRIDD